MKNKSSILHVCSLDKFIPPFIDLIEENFAFEKHFFWLIGNHETFNVSQDQNIYKVKAGFLNKIAGYLRLVFEMHRAEKIILHGLFRMPIVHVLFFMPWLLKKCYWVMWGGDLYVYQDKNRDKLWKRNEFFRRPVIRRIGYLVTYIQGDVELAREWYAARGKYVECLMYLSNVYQDYKLQPKTSDTITILLGNSADPSNEHEAILCKLAKLDNKVFKVIVPLSYGDQHHAQHVIALGKELLGDKFLPLSEFMPFNDYLNILADVDVAVFNHKRQQAMGNTITLLGLGKKVYMRSDVVQWEFLKELGIQVNDVVSLEKNLFDEADVINYKNKEIIKGYFSTENLIKQLKGLMS